MRHVQFTTQLALLLALIFTQNWLSGQTVLEGYTFEENDRGYLQQVKITVYRLPENAVLAELATDESGHFQTPVAPGEYRVTARKDVFQNWDTTLTVGAEKQFLKVRMQRKPGYLFDATIAEYRENADIVVDAIQGADIEIYNRTKKKPELVLRRHKSAFFQFTFEQGNHYTILVRKPGFLAKRIEAYVNIEGCIICVHGVEDLRPGITENLTKNNSMGTLLCNIELERARLDKRIAIRNIFYDFDKWNIRPDAATELDNVVHLMTDNSGINIELGSHTDARGNDQYNLDLSQKRAESAVAYIVSEGIAASRITAKGYGETQLANRCANGVKCSETEHQENRRTELRITGISTDSLEYMRWLPLEEIVREEEFRKGLKDLENQQVIKIEGKAEGPKSLPEPAPTRHRQKQMPEANNSVPLPKFEPQTQPEPVSETVTVTPHLPAEFSGFNVEIARTDVALADGHPIFQQGRQVFLQTDAEGMFCYFIGNFDSAARARNFWQTVAVPKFPDAKLCQFQLGTKTYIN